MSQIFNNNFEEVCFVEPCYNELSHVLIYTPTFEELFEMGKSEALTLNIPFQENAFMKIPYFILGWSQNYWKTIYLHWNQLNLPLPQLRPTFIQLKAKSPSYQKLSQLYEDDELFEQEYFNSIQKLARMANVSYHDTNPVDVMLWADHFWDLRLEKHYQRLVKEDRSNRNKVYPSYKYKFGNFIV